MKKYFTTAALLATVWPAHAALWQPVTSDQELTVSVDLTSVSKAGKYIKAWTNWQYASQQVSSGPPTFYYASSKFLMYFSCPTRTFSVTQLHYYSESGTVVKSFNYKLSDDGFNEVIPDSHGEAILTYLCKKKPPG
jgi:hypothetical protein